MTLYRPLAGSDLRLLRVKPGLFEDPIECELEVFTAEQNPTYVALSYVWGEPNDTETISVNGSVFHATRNLYHALQQFRAWARDEELFSDAERPWVWADAISLNQGDLDEKSKQVPRMGVIYGSAEMVVCWLGLSDGVDEEAIRKLFDKCNAIGRHEKARDVTWLHQYPLPSQLGQQYELAKSAFSNIIQRPWFSRIWTVQEAVLATKEPILAVGKHVVELRGLSVTWFILQAVETDPLYEATLRFNTNVFKIDVLRLEDKNATQRDNDLTSFAQRLCAILEFSTDGYKCTVPHDMIYGMLGLTHAPKLPAQLAPNYNLSFNEVYSAYTQFFIEETGDLSLLLHYGNRLEGSPSWTVDFRALGSIPGKSTVPASITFSEDGKRLGVRGVNLGTCTQILAPQRTYKEIDNPIEALRSLVSDHEQLLVASSTKRGIPFKVVLSNWLESFAPLNINILKLIYNTLAPRPLFGVDEIDRRFLGIFAPENEEMGIDLFNQVQGELFAFLSAYTHIVSAEGVIAEVRRSNADVSAEDILCVFMGSSAGFLLRPCQGEFWLVSGCSIRVGLPHQLGEEFFANQTIRSFSLV